MKTAKTVPAKEFTSKQLREYALEYAATHQHDYAQVFTTPDCKVHRARDGSGAVCAQVWVCLPLDWLPPT